MISGLAIVVFLVRGNRDGLSVLLGGLAYWFPTSLFAWKVFGYESAREAKRFVFVFFAGEMVKLFLSAVLFVLIIRYFSVKVLAMMIGFIAAIITFWIVWGIHLGKRVEKVK